MTKERYVIVFECVRKTLRVVEVNGYNGMPFTERVITYLLKYGCVLENLSIRLSDVNRPLYLQIARQLLCFPRANPNVRISIT